MSHDEEFLIKALDSVFSLTQLFQDEDTEEWLNGGDILSLPTIQANAWEKHVSALQLLLTESNSTQRISIQWIQSVDEGIIALTTDPQWIQQDNLSIEPAMHQTHKIALNALANLLQE